MYSTHISNKKPPSVISLPNLLNQKEIDKLFNIAETLSLSAPIIYESPQLDAFQSKEQAKLFSSSIEKTFLFRSLSKPKPFPENNTTSNNISHRSGSETSPTTKHINLQNDSELIDFPIKLGHNLHSIPFISKLIENKIYPKIMLELEKTQTQTQTDSNDTYNNPFPELKLKLKLKPKIKFIQSMYYFKPPGSPGVPPHQDSTFVYDINYDCVGLFIALDKCSVDNGGLYFADKFIPVSERLESSDPENSQLINLTNKSSSSIDTVDTLDTVNWIPIPELNPGDAILFSGYLHHFSYGNHSNTSRRAFTLHGIYDTIHPKCWLAHPHIDTEL